MFGNCVWDVFKVVILMVLLSFINKLFLLICWFDFMFIFFIVLEDFEFNIVFWFGWI